MFRQYDENGNLIRKRVVCDCSNDPVLTEQAHVPEVDINNIVRRHGMDLIQKTALLQSAEYRFDDVSGNDFQEALNIITKAQSTFDALPSALRKRFNNNPAEYVDFVQDPDNQESLIEMGLAQRLPTQSPVEVVITNPETPPE